MTKGMRASVCAPREMVVLDSQSNPPRMETTGGNVEAEYQTEDKQTPFWN